MNPDENYTDYLKRVEEESRAELMKYAPKVRDLLDGDLGQYIVSTIQLIIDSHTSDADSLQAANPLRSYDAAKGARDVLDALNNLAEMDKETA